MFVFMFVCITLPHIAIVIMELSEIKDCIEIGVVQSNQRFVVPYLDSDRYFILFHTLYRSYT